MQVVAVNAENTLLISGAIDDWDEVRRRGVTTVVDLDGDIDPGVPEAPNELLYVYFPIRDEEKLPDLAKLEAVGRLVADLVDAGQVVLVHCLMGANRSGLLAATVLTFLGSSGREALEQLRRANPGALFNPYFADHVAGLSARRRVASPA
jgi:hypothetical protein